MNRKDRRAAIALNRRRPGPHEAISAFVEQLRALEATGTAETGHRIGQRLGESFAAILRDDVEPAVAKFFEANPADDRCEIPIGGSRYYLAAMRDGRRLIGSRG